MKGAAPKLSDERCRQVLAYALEQRDKGTLFVHVLASELEALAQEALDSRTALLVLNGTLDELEDQLRVSKSSPKPDRVEARDFVHAPVRK